MEGSERESFFDSGQQAEKLMRLCWGCSYLGAESESELPSHAQEHALEWGTGDQVEWIIRNVHKLFCALCLCRDEVSCAFREMCGSP